MILEITLAFGAVVFSGMEGLPVTQEAHIIELQGTNGTVVTVNFDRGQYRIFGEVNTIGSCGPDCYLVGAVYIRSINVFEPLADTINIGSREAYFYSVEEIQYCSQNLNTIVYEYPEAGGEEEYLIRFLENGLYLGVDFNPTEYLRLTCGELARLGYSNWLSSSF